MTSSDNRTSEMIADEWSCAGLKPVWGYHIQFKRYAPFLVTMFSLFFVKVLTSRPLIRVALYMIYTYQSVTHTTWFIPYIKVYTVKIALDKKYFVKMSRGGERERNKKIFKSLYSATTLINLFDYFIEHLWRHVWLRYDVNFYDS